jgi:glucose-6-phosphate 1-dehydrogenase
MIDRLLLFGATGDLAGRFLIPALGALHEQGRLPAGFRVTAAAPREMTDDALRDLVRERLATHAPGLHAETRDELPARFHFRQVDFRSAELEGQVRNAVGDGGSAVAAYLALPPALFAPAITALSAARLQDGSRIVIEKPFGSSLDEARKLNALVARAEQEIGGGADTPVFRVDHVLGLPTVQNFIGLRMANRVVQALWSGVHIERIEILWEETLALEGRAGYFDTSGTLRDVMQNHMMQLLALTAMEPPASMSPRDVAAAKIAALNAVRPPTAAEMRTRTRRARYTAGTLPANADSSLGHVPDYTSERGVDPQRETETFAEVVVAIDTPRWKGTEFVLRAGKALRQRRKEIVVRFRPLADAPSGESPLPNVLRIGIDGPSDVVLDLAGVSGEGDIAPALMALAGSPPLSGLPAYAFVLLDVLRGGSALAVNAREAEEAWRIVTPVLDAWRRGLVPLEEYAAGSGGPPALLRERGQRAA